MTAQPQHGTAQAVVRDRIFWSLLVVIAILDVVTKRWAERALGLHVPEDVVGHWLRWTLTYNPGAAMNISLGAASNFGDAFAFVRFACSLLDQEIDGFGAGTPG